MFLVGVAKTHPKYTIRIWNVLWLRHNLVRFAVTLYMYMSRILNFAWWIQSSKVCSNTMYMVLLQTLLDCIHHAKFKILLMYMYSVTANLTRLCLNHSTFQILIVYLGCVLATPTRNIGHRLSIFASSIERSDEAVQLVGVANTHSWYCWKGALQMLCCMYVSVFTTNLTKLYLHYAKFQILLIYVVLLQTLLDCISAIQSFKSYSCTWCYCKPY